MTAIPFKTNERKSMTPQRRARIFAMRGGICGDASLGEKDWGCSRKLGPRDGWTVEHNPALENGGTDDDAHCWLTCDWCLARKNKDDDDIASEARHRFTNHVVPGKYRRSRSWGRR